MWSVFWPGTVQLVIVFDGHSSSMKDADHDAGGWPFLNDFRQPRAHAPNCMAMSAMSFLRNASVIWKHTVKLDQLCYLRDCFSALASRHWRSSTRENHDEAHGVEDLSFHGLPDRIVITVVAKRVLWPDISNQPNFIGKEACGIHDTSFQNYLRWDVSTCKTTSCCPLAKPCSNGLLSTWRKNSRTLFITETIWATTGSNGVLRHDGGTCLLTLFTMTIHQGGEEAATQRRIPHSWSGRSRSVLPAWRHQWYALSQDERVNTHKHLVFYLRNVAQLPLTSTQTQHRPRKVRTLIRPTCSQTKTSSQSASNASASRVYCPSWVSPPEEPAEFTAILSWACLGALTHGWSGLRMSLIAP